MSKAFFELERIDPDGLRRVASHLRSLGYVEDGIRDRLGLKDISAIDLAAYPYYINHRLRRRGPLDVAIILFLLQGTVTQEELRDVLDKDMRRVLRLARVLRLDRAAKTWRARVSLYPVAEHLFFTDHRFHHHPWLAARQPRDPVMYLGADTHYLARATIRKPIRAALDLCSGSGIHTILAAAQAERAVGVDLSGRAVNFGRLNAVLNDAWNAVFLEGDLFGPVAGERFDLIVANPPFVPSPVYELTYRDGGPSGADVLRRIIASIPDHLAQDGVAHIVTHVAEREGESYLERIRRWLVGANLNMHSLRLGEEDVVDYAVSHVKRTFGERWERYSPKLTEWVTNLRSQRFQRVLGLVLTFQWNEDAPHPPWTQEDEAKPPMRPMSGELQRLLSAKRRVRRLPSLQALDRMRVGVPDDLLLVERRRPTGSGFETKDFRILFRSATLSPELDVKPLVRDLLERIDNRSTVPQVIARLARDTGQSTSDIDDRCRRAFLVMLERGLVTLDEVQDSEAQEAPELVRPAAANGGTGGTRVPDGALGGPAAAAAARAADPFLESAPQVPLPPDFDEELGRLPRPLVAQDDGLASPPPRTTRHEDPFADLAPVDPLTVSGENPGLGRGAPPATGGFPALGAPRAGGPIPDAGPAKPGTTAPGPGAGAGPSA